MPQRIQLSRAKGWRMPAGAVKVDRSTKWGNPITLDRPFDFLHVLRFAGAKGDRSQKEWRRDACAHAFRFVMTAERREVPADEVAAMPPIDRETVLRVGLLPEIADVVASLRGKDLACWCPLSSPCHADVLLEIANAP